MRRAGTDRSDGLLDEESLNSSMFLLHQNKALYRESQRYKRQIAEAKKELELMRNKSREMESLVSVIQRSWSQLDIDASLLLDGLGDSEMVIEGNEKFKILNLFLSAGQKQLRTDATNTRQLTPKLNLDEWSSKADIDTEKSKAASQMSEYMAQERAKSPAKIPSDADERMQLEDGQDQAQKVGDEEDDEEEDLGSQLEEHLLSHVSFTMALLERLCIFIAESGVFERTPEVVQAIAHAKTMHAERLLLQDRIEMLMQDVVELEAQLHLCKQQKSRAERSVDRMTEEVASLRAAVAAASTSPAATSAASASGEVGDPAATAVVATAVAGAIPASRVVDSGVEAELKRKIAMLEQQLAESESDKSKVEMTLTERLARPLTQTEAQITDMRKSMEELRTQCKQRVASLITEGTDLQEKVVQLEIGMAELEAASTVRFEELTAATKLELDKLKKERDEMHSALLTAQAEIAQANEFKSQLEEYQSLDAVRLSDVNRLQEQVKSLSDKCDELRTKLHSSRSRELTLERILVEAKVIHPEWSPSESLSPSETTEGVVDLAGKTIDEFSALVLTQAQSRAREAQQELEDIRASMDDLFLEIEAVSSEQRKVAEQNAKLVTELSNTTQSQRGMREDNLRMLAQVTDLHRLLEETKQKHETVEAVLKQQDAVITHQRQAEQALRLDMTNLRRSTSETLNKRHVDEQELLEAQQKLSLSVHSLDAAKKRNMELQARCDELGKKLEAERKQRMEAQRDAKGKKKDKDRSNAGEDTVTAAATGTGVMMSNEDVEMLEISLGMLRCSVCRDRFKEVAINRCFHLFCRPCIDENIRNRHRKCPACGEKFGADDVKTVYFTH